MFVPYFRSSPDERIWIELGFIQVIEGAVRFETRVSNAGQTRVNWLLMLVLPVACPLVLIPALVTGSPLKV